MTLLSTTRRPGVRQGRSPRGAPMAPGAPGRPSTAPGRSRRQPSRLRPGPYRRCRVWNIYQDFKDPNYQLVDAHAVKALFNRSGILPGMTVVFYGNAPAMDLWLVKLYGHADVRILDCARGTWQEEGWSWTKDVPLPPATSYPLPHQDRRIRAERSTVQEAIQEPNCTILDVRSAPEFRGEQFWPSGGLEPGGRAGHVPSAKNVSIERLRDQDGASRSAAEVHQLFVLIDPCEGGDVISYCTIGGRACTAWFALRYLLGYPRPRV
jgi:thiosulfate/3-mercaptopyruvate sulfurtransferase